MGKETLNVGIVGAGYWGKNLVRNFATASRCRLKYVCNFNTELLLVQKSSFPFIETTTEIDAVLNDSEIGAVVITTNVPSHFKLAQKSLEAGVLRCLDLDEEAELPEEYRVGKKFYKDFKL